MRIWAFILLMAATACGGRGKKQELPANVIPEETMVPLLLDMQLIEGAKSNKFFLGDTGAANYALLYTTIFEKHGVEKAQFDSSMAYYTHHSAELENIYDKVIEELMKIEATEMASGAKEE